MADGFFSYLLAYYRREIERLEQGSHDADVPLQGGDHLLAASLLKFLYDMRDEGYQETWERFESEVDAQSRLAALLRIPAGTDPQTAILRLYGLCPETPRLTVPGSPGFVGRVPVSEYLESLYALGREDLDLGVFDFPENRLWRTRTHILLREMVDYLFWIVAGPVTNYACLLRDTLLLYIGLRLLKEAGVPIGEVRPLFVSRAYFDLCGQGEFYYDVVSDQVYAALAQCRSDSYVDFRAVYRSTVVSVAARPEYGTVLCRLAGYVDHALAGRAEGEALQRPYLLVETGLQGSIPMFLDYLCPVISGFRMYTTAPWLAGVLGRFIYKANYVHLRDIETLVSHDMLFAATDMDRDQIYVAETDNALVRALARYEIVTFREMVLERLAETGPGVSRIE
jgi:hypothetical protein